MIQSAVFLLGLITYAGSATGQNATTSVSALPQRDPSAVSLLTTVISVMGGTVAISAVKDATVVGTITPTADSSTKAGTLTLKDAPPEFLSEIQSAADTSIFASGNGKPASSRQGIVTSLLPHMAQAVRPWHLPGVVLNRELADPAYTLTLAGPAAVNGTAALHVHISLDADKVSAEVTPQEWYFDAATGLPLRVEYRLPDSLRPDSFDKAAAEFSRFQRVNGILIPMQIVVYGNEARAAVITMSSVVFNSGLTALDFELPTGGN